MQISVGNPINGNANKSIIANLISVTILIIFSSDEQCKIQINTQLKTRILILEYCSPPVRRVRISQVYQFAFACLLKFISLSNL